MLIFQPFGHSNQTNAMDFHSKLPNVGTTIFTVMSALAEEHGAINLSQGFPNFSCSTRLVDLVGKYMKQGYNQYAPMPGVPALRKTIAGKIKLLYGVDVDPDKEITITAGATQALYSAITAFVKPGDEVVIVEPAYDSYKPAIELNGGIPVTYEMSAPDYKVEWSGFEKLITWRTRMIVINSPHNPTGKIFREEDWVALKKILRDRQIMLLSDEAYEHLVFDGNEHLSALKYPDLTDSRLAVFSLGKTLHATGWKIGCLVASEELTREFRKVHQFNVFAVNTPAQHAIAEFLQSPEEYLGLNAFFQNKRDLFLDAMSHCRMKPIHSEGTYFQLFDYSELSKEPDTDFCRRLTIEKGVAAIPVSVFNSSGSDSKVIRFCFAKTEETLTQAAKRLRDL
jgi:methionine aminotransferase